MPKTNSIISKIISEVLTRYPDTPTLTLAKKLHKEEPAVFLNIEAARGAIRYRRGTSGKHNRRWATHTKAESPKNPFDDLPEELADYKDWKPVKLSEGKWLILADAHIPYYKRKPFEIALQAGLDEKVTGIVLLGDMADFYSVSFWQKDPRRRNFKTDRQALLKMLDVMRVMFPNIPIYYKLGNHEERLERYLKTKAPELLDCELLSFESIIEAGKYEIDIVADKKILKIGRLFLLHGHEFGMSFFSPVNPARGLYLRGKEIALCAHYHQSSQHTEKSLADIITSCWSIGCLSDLHPEWKPLNKWCHGFAIVDNRDKEFRVYNRRIINGQIF